MQIVILIAGLLLATVANAAEVTIPDDVMAGCKTAGGCALIRLDVLKEKGEELYLKGVEEGRAQAEKEAKSCRKDST